MSHTYDAPYTTKLSFAIGYPPTLPSLSIQDNYYIKLENVASTTAAKEEENGQSSSQQ